MILSLGHSTLPKGEFRKLCQSMGVVADIRSHPRSGAHPQFDMIELGEWMRDKYEWWPQLGGWTERHRDLPGFDAVDLAQYAKAFPKHHIAKQRAGAPQGSWSNQGLYDYSWYTLTDDFRQGIQALVQRAQFQTVGIMCAERSWWKCHRSMVADFLGFRGIEVVHLPDRYVHSHYLSARLERYDDEILDAWAQLQSHKEVHQ